MNVSQLCPWLSRSHKVLLIIANLLSHPFPSSTFSKHSFFPSLTHHTQASPLDISSFFCLERLTQISQWLASCHFGPRSNESFLTIQPKLAVSLYSHSVALVIFFSHSNPLDFTMFTYVLINVCRLFLNVNSTRVVCCLAGSPI